jgi:prefoldin beta subunit
MVMQDSKKLQEIQFLEQNLRNLLLQKQSFEMELSEINSALKEIETSEEDVFKLIGQLLIKTEKSKIKKELEDKSKMLELRIGSFEKQEKNLTEQLEKFRENLTKGK